MPFISGWVIYKSYHIISLKLHDKKSESPKPILQLWVDPGGLIFPLAYLSYKAHPAKPFHGNTRSAFLCSSVFILTAFSQM